MNENDDVYWLKSIMLIGRNHDLERVPYVWPIIIIL